MTLQITDVSETALLTLYCHALDAKSRHPVLDDYGAVNTLDFLNEYFSKSDRKLHQLLGRKKINKYAVLHVVVRAKKYDDYARHFIHRYPDAAIVNIGCGLDNRFERIDNGKIDFYDLDLPGIMDIKRQLFGETDRYHHIAQSVFDFEWMDRINSKHVIFLAEGVFMYCEKDDVRSLLKKLVQRFPGSEMVCEVFNSMWLRGPMKNLVSFKLQRQLGLGKKAVFRFGIRNGSEMESWDPGISILDEWSFFESEERKMAWLKLFSRNRLFTRTLWTTHLRLGQLTL